MSNNYNVSVKIVSGFSFSRHCTCNDCGQEWCMPCNNQIAVCYSCKAKEETYGENMSVNEIAEACAPYTPYVAPHSEDCDCEECTYINSDDCLF